MLITFKKYFQKIIMFDQIAGHYGSDKLTCKNNHYSRIFNNTECLLSIH